MKVKRRGRWLVILLLWLFWARLLHVAAVKSDTFDEMFHIMYGVLYWQHPSLEPIVQNPPLVDALIGLPVSLLFQPTLPFEHPTWSTENWLRIAQAFLWQINDNGLQLLWTGRFATMCLALLLGAIVYRWSRELGRTQVAGLAALLLCTFDPNILAHSTLATGDLGMTFFLCLGAYLVWRYWQKSAVSMSASQPSAFDTPNSKLKTRNSKLETQNSALIPYLLAAAGIGFVLAAKFSGLVFLPAIVLMQVYRYGIGPRAGRKIGRAAAELVGWFFLAGLIFLVIYRFDFNTLALDFSRQQEHQLTGHSTYLFGELSKEGWWYYFPVLFVLKTPLPVLVLLAAALLSLLIRRRFDGNLLWPLLVAAGIGGASLLSRVNIGYRYLLPALPLLYVFVGQWLGRLGSGEWKVLVRQRTAYPMLRMLPAFFLLWFSLESLFIHPDYLAYFNPLAGGAAHGWRIAVDSNVDWGQDIKPLGRYLTENNITRPVQIAWLGTGPLDVYGIHGTPLPAWPNAPEDLFYSPFYPPRPAPGFYVLSVTQLQGVYLSDPQRFAWFQAQTPDDRVGYSLFVYDVAADGPPVGVALSGVGLATVTATDFNQTINSNDVRPRWYDARSAFLWPGETPDKTWAVVGAGHIPAHPLLQTLYPAPTLVSQGADDLHYHLYVWDASPIRQALARNAAAVYTDFGYSLEPVVGANEWTTLRRPLHSTPVFGASFELLGYETDSVLSGETLSVISYWRLTEGIASSQWNNLRVFVHLLDSTGQVIAQHDGLDVSLHSLQTGDEFAQLHTITLPAALPSDSYALQIGLYEPESSARLTVLTPSGPVDRLLLHRFSLP